MSWYPDRLLVANVAGRALLADPYSIGEWRRDPWSGFDLPEGTWERVRGHSYKRARRFEGSGFAEVTSTETIRRVRDLVRDFQFGRKIEYVGQERPAPWSQKMVLVNFDNDQWVNRSLLHALHFRIDGKPAYYRRDHRGDHWPVHLFDERDRWLGAIMPVRIFER